MVDWRETGGGKETAMLLDLSQAGNSAQACQLVDGFLEKLKAESLENILIDVNAGDLLLTRGVLTKIKQQIQRQGSNLGIVYALVPQTQQAALDEGLFVKEKISFEWVPLRQPLPMPNVGKEPVSSRLSEVGEDSLPLGKLGAVTRPPAPQLQFSNKTDSVQLPDFKHPKQLLMTRQADFEVVAPQDRDIPELTAPEVEWPESPRDEVMEALVMEPSVDASVATPLAPREVVYADNALQTLYLRQNFRSGQTIRFNGNIIVVGDVHAGSEITAGGDIIVWGELRGVAHAGAQGNYKSEVRAMKIEALQLRIADYIARRPDRIFYHKDGTESLISPEVARVADGEIKIFKTTLARA